MNRATRKEFDSLVDRVSGLEEDLRPSDDASDLGLASLRHLVLPQDPSPAELEDAMIAQPGCFAYWGAVYKDAAARVAELQDDWAVWWAGACEEARSELPKSPKPTEAAVKGAAVEKYRDEHDRRKKEIREAERVAEQLKYVVKAWEQKHTLLFPLARQLEREINNTEVSLGERRDDSPPAAAVSEEVRPKPEPPKKKTSGKGKKKTKKTGPSKAAW